MATPRLSFPFGRLVIRVEIHGDLLPGWPVGRFAGLAVRLVLMNSSCLDLMIGFTSRQPQ